MNSIVATLRELADIESDYSADATSTWDSTTNKKYTVPAGERWFLYGGTVTRDANQTLIVTVKDASDQTVIQLDSQGAGTGLTAYPNQASTGAIVFPLPMDAGYYVDITCGGAQGAGAIATIYYERVGV